MFVRPPFTIAVAGVLLFAHLAPAQVPTTGIWIDRYRLTQLEMAGPEWNSLVAQATQPCGTPRLDNQNDPANTCVMAKALVAARTNDVLMRRGVITALAAVADGPPYRGRALALGRELIGYVVSADIIELREKDPDVDRRFRQRLTVLLTTPTTGGPDNLIQCHEQRPNNWGAHCGASRIAVAAYLGDILELARAAQVFRGFLGEREAYSGFIYGDLSWQCDAEQPVPLNPAGCDRDGRSLDGVIPDDQRRGGAFRWPAPKENYVYEALQGALAQAVILHRNGYPAFEWGDQALLRSFTWLYDQARFPATGDDAWLVNIINHYYGTRFTAAGRSRPGKNLAWTEWTHRR